MKQAGEGSTVPSTLGRSRASTEGLFQGTWRKPVGGGEREREAERQRQREMEVERDEERDRKLERQERESAWSVG